jgi:hypothetical protein
MGIDCVDYKVRHKDAHKKERRDVDKKRNKKTERIVKK